MTKPTRAELLDSFEAVCNTMAYAHIHGVIHRDLKPANVMLGKYGETFVVDWGLAKIREAAVADEAPAEELTAMTVPGEDSGGEELTAAGKAMGTYQYIPPEQAHGDYASLNERADVFALGAMLCKILTGQPPYAGKQERVIQMARNADLTACFARLDGSGADPELIALAKRCLEKSATDRPGNAKAVLDAVRANKATVEARGRKERERRATAEANAALQGELRVAAEGKAAEERRRRRVTVALALSIVAFLIVGGGGLWAWQEQRALRQVERNVQAKQNRDNAETTLEHLNELHKRFLWDVAETQLTDSERRLLGSEDDANLRERVMLANKNTAFIKQLDEIRLAKSVIVDGKLNKAGAPSKYRAAFEGNGFDVLNGDRAELAAKLNSSQVKEYLLAALDDWALTDGWPKTKETEGIMALTVTVTGQSWRDRLTAALGNGARLAELYDAIPVNERTPAIIEMVGFHLHNHGQDGIRRIEEALPRYPGDFWLHFRLGLMGGPARVDARIGALRAARAIRPDIKVVLQALGDLHFVKKEYDAAMAAYKEAIDIDPMDAKAHCSLGNVFHAKKEYDAAVAEYNKAISLDLQFALPHIGLGNTFYSKKQYDAALAQYKAAVRIDPNTTESHHNLGKVYHAKKVYDAAVAEYVQAIQFNSGNAIVYRDLGVVYQDLGRFDESVASLRKADGLSPNNPEIQNWLKASQEYLTLDQRLAAIRDKTDNPETPSEAVHFADLASRGFKKEYALAFRLYTEAFTVEPTLVEANRYKAACAATQFAAGNDVRSKPGMEEWHYLQKQARAWLEADLAALRQLAERQLRRQRLALGVKDELGNSGLETADLDRHFPLQQFREKLTHWLEDSNLDPVREAEGLKAMPDDERKAWRSFWAQVQMLQKLIAPKE